MNYKISIIVPMYNSENYIIECINSIIKNIPDNVEIIVVDDGSTDKSIKLIEKRYINLISAGQLKLLKQKNAGPGAARNKGISIAEGKYIAFLDSDDILFDNYFEKIFLEIVNNDIDIIEFGFIRFDKVSDLQKYHYKSPHEFNGTFNLNEIRNKIFGISSWFSWTRIYKKEIFDNIKFPNEKVFYEDVMTIPMIYLEDYKIKFINEALVGYRYNPNSTTSKHEVRHTLDLYSFYLKLSKLEMTIPTTILKIKIGRDIAYFYNELKSETIPIKIVMDDIKKIKININLIKSLKSAERFFLLFPRIYMFIDNIRLKRRR